MFLIRLESINLSTLILLHRLIHFTRTSCTHLSRFLHDICKNDSNSLANAKNSTREVALKKRERERDEEKKRGDEVTMYHTSHSISHILRQIMVCWKKSFKKIFLFIYFIYWNIPLPLVELQFEHPHSQFLP